MTIKETLAWQWKDYLQYHQSQLNLWIHIVAVPIFILATLSLISAIFRLDIISAIYAILIMAVSFAVQGLGHSKEAVPSVPFEGPANALTRIFLEQFITFPKYVITGKWYAALKKNA